MSARLALRRLESIALAREAVNCAYWPLFEVEDGEYHLTYRPRHKLPLAPWLKQQGRFAHLFKPGNEEALLNVEAWVDSEWEKGRASAGRVRRGGVAGASAEARLPAEVSAKVSSAALE